MKNRILSLAILAMSAFAGTNAMALVGGPFDNNNYSVLLERGGVYQASLTYRNGSGIAQFAADNDATVQGGTVSDTVFKLGNRSILYYKGITYAGTCTGMADLDARRVFAVTNGTTNLSSLENAALANPVVVNGATAAPGYGYANSTYNAKITTTSPILRFRGSGEASFVMDQNLTTLSNIAFGSSVIGNANTPAASNTSSLFANLWGSLVNLSTANGLPVTATNPAIITPALATAATNALLGLSAQVNSFETIQNSMETVKMRVYGSRRYF